MKNLTHYTKLVISVCLCSIVTFSNIYWLQPLLPLVQKSFHITPLAANLTMSAPLLGMGLGLLIFASWSDAIGRYKILLGGTLAGLCISLLLPFVQHYSLFLVLRFAQGTFLSVCPAVAIPFLGDELRKSWLPTAVGFYIAFNTIGGISSRLVGGISAEYLHGLAQAGMVISGLSSLLFVVVWSLLPQQRRFKPVKFEFSASIKMFATHLKNPQLVLIYLIIGLAFGCLVNLSNYLMLVLGDAPYHLPSDLRSLMFLTYLGGTLSSSLVGRFTKKHDLISGIILGIGIMFIANFIMSWNAITAMIIGMIMTCVGFFFCHAQASALVGKSVSKGKGSAQALYSLFYYAGASLGVFCFEPFFQTWGWQGVLSASKIALALCILFTILHQLIHRELKNASRQLSHNQR